MDLRRGGQDVLRCHLCDNTAFTMFCDICHTHLCKVCVGEHLSDEYKEHRVVQFRNRGSTPKCPKHSTKICELHCEECDIPICASCVSCGEHEQHKKIDILKCFTNKKRILQKDFKELEEIIFPEYQEIASDIPVQEANLRKNSQKVTTAINKHEKVLKTEIDIMINNMKIELDEMDSKYLVCLHKHENQVAHNIYEIKQSIAEVKKLLESKDIYNVSSYKSRNADFRRLPPQHTISLPKFNPSKINKQLIYQLIGSLSKMSIESNERTYTLKPKGDMASNTVLSPKKKNIYKQPGSSSASFRKPNTPAYQGDPAMIGFPCAKPLIEKQQLISEINTQYDDSNQISEASCLSDEEIWTCGEDNIMRLYHIKGELIKSIKTMSGNNPLDIAVTVGGSLVYIDVDDDEDRALKIVKKKTIQTLIKQRGWGPSNVCIASSGDILVTMISGDQYQTKVVRYTVHLIQKQSIQFDEKGEPLYSTDKYIYNKSICENKNLDICVADCGAGAVVVVNKSGRLRYRYTGSFHTEKSFDPVGITTDSQSRILISDNNNHLIHIIDEEGHFLRYIKDIRFPMGLCVDTNDNLFVAENEESKVKKIKYCM